MKTRLPDNLNPTRFDNAVNVYSDKYRDRYSVEYGNWAFLIPNKLPFTLFVCAGVNGEDLYERKSVVDLLRISQRIHADQGRWPELSDEWEAMCPGGLIMLNVSSLAEIAKSAPTILEILSQVSTHLDNILSRPGVPFAAAEKYYQDVLTGLASFDASCRMMQREFDEFPVRALNTNTKSRRLRYVAVLSRSAESGVDSRRLQTDLLAWASLHTSELAKYSDSKGAVLKQSGIKSAGPYLELAKNLGLLVSVGRGLTLANQARAMLLIAPPSHTFELCAEERLYFLYDILIHDRDIITPLLKHLNEGDQSKRNIRKVFQTLYIEHLLSTIRYCGTARSRKHIDDAVARVKTWKKPEIYMEHVVDPRISWFVDLRLCTLNNDIVSLTEAGKYLAKTLTTEWEEEVSPLTSEHLRNSYFKRIAPSALASPQQFKRAKVPIENVIKILNESCEHLLRHTRSLAPNRIVASTLFRYLGIFFFTQQSATIDFTDLIKFFTSGKTPDSVSWQLRWLPAQKDGYLTRIATRVSV